jgi:hypothetical protein
VTAPETPAPAEHPAAGAGLTPAQILARLHALADRMDADRAGHEHFEKHWRAMKDAVREAGAAGRVRQLADDARDLRNLANDIAKEVPDAQP